MNKQDAKSMGYWEWTSFPNFLWNWRFQKNLIRFDETFDSEGEVIPVTSVMGIPVIGVKIEEKDQQVFFDTGAQLSYADPDLMNGKDAIGEMEGFIQDSEILKLQSMN